LQFGLQFNAVRRRPWEDRPSTLVQPEPIRITATRAANAIDNDHLVLDAAEAAKAPHQTAAGL
jgi:hypothetical protein